MTTPILGIEEMSPSQAQPELVVNEAARILESFGNIPTVVSRAVSSPPGSPSQGDRYIIPVGATGAWAGLDLQIAVYANTDWVYREAIVGWIAYVSDEDAYIRFAASSPPDWVSFP